MQGLTILSPPANETVMISLRRRLLRFWKNDNKAVEQHALFYLDLAQFLLRKLPNKSAICGQYKCQLIRGGPMEDQLGFGNCECNQNCRKTHKVRFWPKWKLVFLGSGLKR